MLQLVRGQLTTGGIVQAMAVHDFGDTLSIIGGFSFMVIGVIVPILLYIAQNKEDMSMCTMVGLIILVGQVTTTAQHSHVLCRC